MATREMSALDRAVATHIRVLAAKKKMNQAAIAASAGIPTSTFSRYWNGDRSMTLGDLERILEALGTSYAQEAGDIRSLMRGE